MSEVPEQSTHSEVRPPVEVVNNPTPGFQNHEDTSSLGLIESVPTRLDLSVRRRLGNLGIRSFQVKADKDARLLGHDPDKVMPSHRWREPLSPRQERKAIRLRAKYDAIKRPNPDWHPSYAEHRREKALHKIRKHYNRHTEAYKQARTPAIRATDQLLTSKEI